ncbi:MAG: sigma-70 family RNA polymerase sigma factor [Natronospirillum sp.]|uniref:sigma-70 family RNA polymerase sigma factor n=1 Tax=Natronospirillum sp. TaxID=2812955 RepID=UPI0025EC4AF9|nr:sigma-70 family RNA polymerase sigma factor [Natronospirillum sp.]MCH8552244.1 sigma-70 family RNA polymerase sigma factor [Natronospirillum sp.]
MKASDEWADCLEAIAERQDRKSFVNLFNHFAPQIKGYARSSGLTAMGDALADELVQETMTNLWRKAHLFDRSKASATTWVFTIARNLRVDLLRRQRKHHTTLSSDDLWQEPHTEGDGADWVEKGYLERQIRLGIAQLPVDQRQVIGKVFLEDKSHQEAAEDLNLPLGTVKSRIRLALKKLRVGLEADSNE